jgi:hypothetical protein
MTEAAIRSRERMWQARVRAWEASGQSAPRFTAGKDFSASSLLYWRRRLGELARQRNRKPRERTGTRPSFARVVPRGSVPVAGADGTGIVVEVGGVSIRVGRDFDAALLKEVVLALRGGTP